ALDTARRRACRPLEQRRQAAALRQREVHQRAHGERAGRPATGSHGFATRRHVRGSLPFVKYTQMTTAADACLRSKARAIGVLYLLMILIGAIQMRFGRGAQTSQIQFAVAADLLIVVCYLPIPDLFY